MEITDKAAQFVHGAGDKIADASSQAADALYDKSEQLINAEQRLMKNCRRYVRNNPATSLGMAAAAGFMLSLLASGR